MDNFERRLAASMKIAAEQRPDVEPESITHRSDTRRAGFMALAAAVIIGAVIAGTTWLFSPSDSPSPSVPVGEVINLEGEWTLTALNNADGKPLIDIAPGCVDCIPPLAERLSERGYSGPDQMLGAGLFGPNFRPVHLTFEGGRLTGTAGCAKFSASYKQARGQSLTFSDLRRVDDSGRTDCGHPPPTGTPRLLDVRRVSESNGVLSLLAEDGSTIATLERVSTEPISLEGEWVLAALTDADGNGLISDSLTRKVTLGFRSGEVTGFNGCNYISGTYAQSGDQDVRFGAIGTTQQACIDRDKEALDSLPLGQRLADVRHVSEADGKLQLHAANWMIIAVLERESVEPSIDLGDRDPAIWELAPNQALNGNTTEFEVLVTRSGCNSGVTGVVSEPKVVFGAGKISVSFTVPHSNGGLCPSNDAVPVTVHLEQPIGNRILVDGQCSRTDLETTAFCQSDKGVRWADQ